MNEKQFRHWMNAQPDCLFDRFNEIKLPPNVSRMSGFALSKFFWDRAWLVFVRNPRKKTSRLTVVWFNKETGEWSNYK